MERETHNDNDPHIIDIPDDDDSSSDSGSSSVYSAARSSLSTDDKDDIDQHIIDTSNDDVSSSSLSLFTDEETSDEGSSLCAIVWDSVEYVFTSVQIAAALVVLTLAKDEHSQTLLLAWLIVYTCGCITGTLLLSWSVYNQVGVYPGTRMDRVMEELKFGLECFFFVWLILGILWICFGHSSPSDAPNLYRLCVAFIAFSCIRFSAAVLLLLCEGETDSVKEGQGGGFVFQGPISDDCCCICLEKYGGKKRVIRKLECSHLFHLDCIDEWLIVKPTCPLCQSLVGG